MCLMRTARHRTDRERAVAGPLQWRTAWCTAFRTARGWPPLPRFDTRPTQNRGSHGVVSGRGFRHLGPDGASIHDVDTLGRIRSLAIPPAWHDVWICHDGAGHLQAVGRDARGR